LAGLPEPALAAGALEAATGSTTDRVH
jgi:hypothetical protein